MDVRFDIFPVLAEDDLLMWRHVGRTGRLVICLSGIGKEPDTPPPYEFARGATENGQNHVLFVVDPHRTWLNGPRLIERIVAQAQAIIDAEGITEVCTLGHSMGGFSALVLADYLQVTSVVALAPQHSVHPEIAGNETRWREFLDRIAQFRIRSVDDHWQDGPMYHVFHGDHKRDRYQRDRFPIRPRLVHTILPETTHAVPQRLKRAKLLDPVISLCFGNRVRKVRQLLQPLGAYRRTEANHPLLGPAPKVAA